MVAPPAPLPSSYPSAAATTAASATPKKQLAKRRLRLPPSYASGISLARRYPQKHQQPQQHRRQSSSLNYAAQAAYKASLDAFKRGTYSKNAETVSAIRTSPGAKCLVFDAS